MQIAIRVDASIQIGTGHVMRCLTLADALKQRGADVYFICRQHRGDLNAFIESKSYTVFILENLLIEPEYDKTLPHAHWLGCSQLHDAEACQAILRQHPVDWLIVDHYALDSQWEKRLARFYKKLMVIDDLADREHDCSLLLDQTYGRKSEDYLSKVLSQCQLLLGSGYALLRPEFAEWREFSLKRRMNPAFKRLLISLGGVDKDNVTTVLLKALKHCILPADLSITVIMGATAPHLEWVKAVAQTLTYPVDVRVGVTNMAELMAQSDWAISAAGTSTWEWCCLGVPTISIQLADNQKTIIETLDKSGICESLAVDTLIHSPNFLQQKVEKITMHACQFIKKSSAITNGTGIYQVREKLYV